MADKIKINLTEGELQDLLNGRTFTWNYGGREIYLYKGDDDE